MADARPRFVGLVIVLGLLAGSGALTDQVRADGSGTTGVPVAAAPATPAHRLAAKRLTNGCAYQARGIPRCGALLGAAYGANTNPIGWERSMHHSLGVHRTYWSHAGVRGAVRQARRDIAAHRLPWISLKLPRSWGAMAAGHGDSWVRYVARGLRSVRGPVWVAFHHEPEGDGPIRSWTRMQQHIAPIVRRTAHNVGFSLVLTGWNELYGARRYRLGALWPHTKIDVLGFDVYNQSGVVRNGTRTRTRTDFLHGYFTRFLRFARSHDVAWGLAETGHTDWSARTDPGWVLRTYRQLVRQHGIAFSYFNTRLHSIAPWRLVGAKGRAFARALRSSPTL